MLTMARIYKSIPQLEHYKGVFYDANIWIKLYGIYDGLQRDMAKYSAFHKAFLEKGVNIYTDNIVLGEFINVNLNYLKDSKLNLYHL